MFKAQKALHLYEDLDKKKPLSVDRRYFIFEKYDGWWGAKQVSRGGSDSKGIISRALRQIPSMASMSSLIAAREESHLSGTDLPDGHLIFEILVSGHEGDFYTTNGILNRKATATGAYLMVHDYVPTDSPQMPFMERYGLARAYVDAMNVSRIRLAPIIARGTHHDVQAYAEYVWRRNGEGAIGKCTVSGYDYGKRNAACLKVKEELTLDLVVVDIYEGQGKYAGTLGGLTVQGKDGVLHSVSGMSDEERDFWWSSPHKIIGKIVEVKAMKKLKDGSLREPRFKAIRHDKTLNEVD